MRTIQVSGTREEDIVDDGGVLRLSLCWTALIALCIYRAVNIVHYVRLLSHVGDVTFLQNEYMIA